jgi:hypothetical protein
LGFLINVTTWYTIAAPLAGSTAPLQHENKFLFLFTAYPSSKFKTIVFFRWKHDNRDLRTFKADLYSKSWMKITVGTGCSAPIQLDTGTVQGSVLSPLLFDLLLNALLRLLDVTGITHGIKRTPKWNHAAFADDLSIYVGTVRDGNKLLDVIHEFEFWSGLQISIQNPWPLGPCMARERQEGKKGQRQKWQRGKETQAQTS